MNATAIKTSDAVRSALTLRVSFCLEKNKSDIRFQQGQYMPGHVQDWSRLQPLGGTVCCKLELSKLTLN